MAEGKSPALTRGLEAALRLGCEAIDLLDACGAPPDLAAQLELVLQEIKRARDQSTITD